MTKLTFSWQNLLFHGKILHGQGTGTGSQHNQDGDGK